VTQLPNTQRTWSHHASAMTVSENFKGTSTGICLTKPRKDQESLNLNGNNCHRAGDCHFLKNTERSQDREIETESPKLNF